MAEIGNISPTTSGDLSPYFLAVRNQAARGGATTESTQSSGDIIVIGNPGGRLDLNWDLNLFLPGVFYPVTTGYAYPAGSQAAYQATMGALTDLTQKKIEIADKLAAQPDSKPVQLNIVDDQGKTIRIDTTMGEIKRIYGAFVYNVVAGMSLEPGYGGFTAKTSNGYVSNIDKDVFMRYYTSWGARGMSYYLLHELSHNIAEVKSYENVEGPKFLTNNNVTVYDYRYGKSPEFNRIEAVTNTVAFSLAATLGIAMAFDPPHGTF